VPDYYEVIKEPMGNLIIIITMIYRHGESIEEPG
jgi:hypothetical protein